MFALGEVEGQETRNRKRFNGNGRTNGRPSQQRYSTARKSCQFRKLPVFQKS